MSALVPLLLVDDDESNRLIFAVLLEEEGFAVESARSCQEAREMLDPHEPVSVAIIDRNLDGEDGIAFAAEIRAAVPSASIFIHSGDPPELELMEGIDGWLLKGSDVAEVIREIRRSLKSERFPQAPPSRG